MVTENKLVVSTVSGTGAGFGYKGVIEGNLGSADETDILIVIAVISILQNA